MRAAGRMPLEQERRHDIFADRFSLDHCHHALPFARLTRINLIVESIRLFRTPMKTSGTHFIYGSVEVSPGEVGRRSCRLRVGAWSAGMDAALIQMPASHPAHQVR